MSDYELPRLLHKHGDHKRVDTVEQAEAAFAEGWTLLPVVEETPAPVIEEPPVAPVKERKKKWQ